MPRCVRRSATTPDSDLSQVPVGFDQTAWKAVYKLSSFLTTNLTNVAQAFREFDRDGSGEIGEMMAVELISN